MTDRRNEAGCVGRLFARLAAAVFVVEEWWWRHLTHRRLFRVLDARGLPGWVGRELVWLECCRRAGGRP
ncbi:hypothetical protein ACH4PU_34565 [Streptomyces sp. NPDC021100]|uniref:hypothetical protein n=1 Tax=Streptomyces sp. NPDC021100 TaxID=3365114 RepID=UPI00379A2560